MNRRSHFLPPALALSLLALPIVLAGCATSDEQNPISPDQMNQMRAKENAARQGHASPTVTDHGPNGGSGRR